LKTPVIDKKMNLSITVATSFTLAEVFLEMTLPSVGEFKSKY